MKHPTVVSIYTGAGGLDHGFEAAGFRIRAAIDFDHDCCDTLRANRKWPVLERDITTLSSDEILACAKLKRGSVDVLIGGPPCQPFSKAGYWARGDSKRLDDPRAVTLYEYMRCVADFLPTVFLLENVHGINYSGKEEGFLLLKRLTEEINDRHGTKYRIRWKIINSADYGVPQTRTRFFLVAHRDGLDFEFPEATHADPDELLLDFARREPYVTAWDAIGDLPLKEDPKSLSVKGQWGELLPSIPEGRNYLWHTNRGGGLSLFGWRTRYWSFLLKLGKDRPSWTIQAQPGPAIGPFHWENRMLSVDEMARIQTFPGDVKFVGGRQSVQRQIGNAVPSLLAEVLARAIGQQFFSMPHSRPKLRIDHRPSTPPAGSVEPVPAKYLHLVGEHEDHPGTAKRSRSETGTMDLSADTLF